MNTYIAYFDRLRNNPRLLLSGFLVVLGSLFLGSYPASLFRNFYVQNKGIDKSAFEEALMQNPQLANLNLIFNLMPYIVAAFALWFVYKFYLHGSLIESIRPGKKWNIAKLLIPGLIWFLFSLGSDIYFIWKNPDNYVFAFEWQSFAVLLGIGLVLLPVQTGFEEFFFRGYIMNSLNILSRRLWVGLIGSSVLFALMHGMNPEIGQYGFWNMMPIYFYFGFVLALLTVWDQSLEIAWSLHFFNNLYSLLIVSSQGSALKVRPLFMQQEVAIQSVQWYFILSLTLVSILILFLFKLKWPIQMNWKNEQL